VKIFNLGLRDIQPGKQAYKPDCFEKLVEKFSPAKATAYSVEFIDQDIEKAEAVVFDNNKRLDLIVADLEKIETRLSRCENDQEKVFFEKCQKALEKEKLLCELDSSEPEVALLKTLPLVSSKPCLGKAEVGDLKELIAQVIAKAGIILFFTVGKKEVRAWPLEKGLNVLEAAGKIHSDLKRGFIKADVVNCSQLDNFFNMAEARSRGLVEVVDKDYIVKENDIIEIRFSV